MRDSRRQREISLFFCDLFSQPAKVTNVQTRIFAKSKRRSFVRDLTTIHSSKKCYRRMKISKNVASASCELSHRLLSGSRLITISPHLSIQNFRLSNFQKKKKRKVSEFLLNLVNFVVLESDGRLESNASSTNTEYEKITFLAEQ